MQIFSLAKFLCCTAYFRQKPFRQTIMHAKKFLSLTFFNINSTASLAIFGRIGLIGPIGLIRLIGLIFEAGAASAPAVRCRFKTEVQNFGREELILHSPSGGGCPSGGGGLNRTQERTFFSTSN